MAGEGPLLRVFDTTAHQSICAIRVFRRQTIHGIQVRETVGKNGAENALSYVLVWGGRSVCCISLGPTTACSQGHLELHFHHLVPETFASDWILDSCFLSCRHLTQHDVGDTCLDVALLTAHNDLLSFNIPCHSNEGSSIKHVVRDIAAGPRSILYSGHIVLLSSGQVLIAAGTVFGEVILWSYIVEESPLLSKQAYPSLLHYSFLGHEGSVFGVRISDGFSVPGSDAIKRILASCSDDRTIRIWDVSDLTNGTPVERQGDATIKSVETGFTTSSSEAGQVSSNLLAVAMGHLSRIWGVRFLFRHGSTQQLLSYGEDASLQVWQLDLSNPELPSGIVSNVPIRALHHQGTYRFHSGKHIWSVALLGAEDGPFEVFTGGADGCIAYYNILPRDTHEQRVGLWSVQGVSDQCDRHPLGPDTNIASTVASSANSRTKAAFTALEGKWLLTRTIESTTSSCPSGVFEGSAVCQMRTPTDNEYDMECLYVEEGEFTTKQGLSFLGSRRYVYRYQASTDAITAWFVNIDDKNSVDYFFHDLNFERRCSRDLRLEGWGTGSSVAKGYHLCVKDEYWVEYHFDFVGRNLSKWKLQYNVKGPEKDYVASANYTRPDNIDPSKPVSGPREAQDAGDASTEFQRPDLGPQDSFKSYAWVSDVEFLTTTEQGHVLLGTLQNADQLSAQGAENHQFSQSVSWAQLAQQNSLKSYCITTGLGEHGIAFLSGTEGTIYLYQNRGRSVNSLVTLPRKISGLFAQALGQTPDVSQRQSPLTRIGMVASCLGSAKAYTLMVEVDPSRTEGSQSSIVRRLTLTLPSAFIVTSACFANLQKLIILGSRSGALALYDTSTFSYDKTGIAFSCCVRHVHGEDAITVIKSGPLTLSDAGTSTGYLLTTGRDGKYAIHHWKLEPESQASRLIFETVHVATPSFGPNIEGAIFQPGTQDLLLWGFRSKSFVVWNHTKQREVMAIECGGTHRSWAFSPGLKNTKSRMSLVWTKASRCYVDSRPRASHEVLQDGGHGREIKAMAVSPRQGADSGSCYRLVATGAEDTAIRIFSYKDSDPSTQRSPFQCIGKLTKHTTGLQQMLWSKDGQYLFSAGGCEEFYAWRVQPVPFFGMGVACDARCPVKSESADLRIMDFDVVEFDNYDGERNKPEHIFLIAMVYSDSSVRVSVAAPVKMYGI